VTTAPPHYAPLPPSHFLQSYHTPQALHYIRACTALPEDEDEGVREGHSGTSVVSLIFVLPSPTPLPGASTAYPFYNTFTCRCRRMVLHTPRGWFKPPTHAVVLNTVHYPRGRASPRLASCTAPAAGLVCAVAPVLFGFAAMIAPPSCRARYLFCTAADTLNTPRRFRKYRGTFLMLCFVLPDISRGWTNRQDRGTACRASS